MLSAGWIWDIAWEACKDGNTQKVHFSAKNPSATVTDELNDETLWRWCLKEERIYQIE